MIYFIVNRTSGTGNGNETWNQVEELVRTSGISYEVYETKWEGHARELAKQISAFFDEQDCCLIIVGGDGTINEVFDGITDFSKLRIGIIPTGSGNDFCRGVGISRNVSKAWSEILDMIKQGKDAYRDMDLGKVSWKECPNGRFFGISSGVGLDAIVCKKALHSGLKNFLNKIHLGKLTYILITIQTLFEMKTTQGKIAYYDADNQLLSERSFNKLIFSAAMNLRAEGGGVPMAPKATPYDAQLSMCSAYGIPKWRTFLCLPFLMAAKHERIHGFSVENAAKIQLSLADAMTLHADGEYLGEVAEMTFEVMPGMLRLLKQ